MPVDHFGELVAVRDEVKFVEAGKERGGHIPRNLNDKRRSIDAVRLATRLGCHGRAFSDDFGDGRVDEQVAKAQSAGPMTSAVTRASSPPTTVSAWTFSIPSTGACPKSQSPAL